MTYAEFLLIFLITPLVALVAALRRRLLDRRYLALAGALTLVALLYMAPWDHTAAVWGLWSWAPGRTWGLRWWSVPPEEYLFCLLEALLAATLIYAVLLWRGRITSPGAFNNHAAADDGPGEQNGDGADATQTTQERPPRAAGAPAPRGVARLARGALGAHWTYLPFLLVWALPVVAIQWALGGRYLWRERSVWPWVALALCAYFTLADAVAIAAGVWSFDSRALVGVALGPVPLEEILFYLLTALMVTQGFVTLWYGYADRAALAQRARAWLPRTHQQRQLQRLPLRSPRRPPEARDGR